MTRPFRSWHSYIHSTIGFFSAIIRNAFPIASITIALAFYVFQALDNEDDTKNLSDFIEFLVGFSLGLIIS